MHIGKLPKKRAVNIDTFPMTSSDFCVCFSICLINENTEYGRGHVLGGFRIESTPTHLR